MLERKFLRNSLILLLASLVSASYSQTLNEAISHTLANGPDIHESLNNVIEAEHDIRTSKEKLYLPKIYANGTLGYEYANHSKSTIDGKTLHKQQIKAGITKNLFNGFHDTNDLLLRKAGIKQKQADLKGKAAEIAYDVINSYLNVLYYKELNRHAKDTLIIHNKIFARIERKREQGIEKVTELDRARGRLVNSRLSLMSVQAEYVDAENKFRRLVGVAPHDLSMPLLKDDLLPETEDAAVAIAISKHSKLLESRANINAKKAEYLKRRSYYMP